MTRRPDRVLTFIDVFCVVHNRAASRALAVRDHIADRIRGPKCPTCFARTRHLPAHIAIDHAEVTG